VKSNLLNSVI
jgi:hypothetical protein